MQKQKKIKNGRTDTAYRNIAKQAYENRKKAAQTSNPLLIVDGTAAQQKY